MNDIKPRSLIVSQAIFYITLLLLTGFSVSIITRVEYTIWIKSIPLGFAFIAYYLCGEGLYITSVYISKYLDQSIDIETIQKRNEIEEIARKEIEDLYKTSVNNISDTYLKNIKDTLFGMRLFSIIRAFRAGTPMLGVDSADVDERYFSDEDHNIRSKMDIVLNVGIAGTFLSLIFTFSIGDLDSLSADQIIYHIGPGLLSGFAGVITNIMLRLCYRTMTQAQNDLSNHVDYVITEHFLNKIPRIYMSPMDRVANSIKTGLESLSGILINQLSDSMIQINKELEEINKSSLSLANSSMQWETVANDLKISLADYLDAQHRTFIKWDVNIDEIRNESDKAIEKIVINSKDSINKLTDTHKEWTKSMLDYENNQRGIWMNQQQEATAAIVANSIDIFTKKISKHTNNTLEEFTRLLDQSKEFFCEAVSDSFGGATIDIIDQIDTLKTETSKLAGIIDSITQRAGIYINRMDNWQNDANEQFIGWQNTLNERNENWRNNENHRFNEWKENFDSQYRNMQSILNIYIEKTENALSAYNKIMHTREEQTLNDRNNIINELSHIVININDNLVNFSSMINSISSQLDLWLSNSEQINNANSNIIDRYNININQIEMINNTLIDLSASINRIMEDIHNNIYKNAGNT